MLRSRVLAGVASIVASAVVITGCDPDGALSTGESPGTHASKGGKSDKGDAATARKELGELKVAVPGSMAGYSRERFGPAWKDVDHNGCDTRNDILARDLDDVRKRDGCVVVSGDLDDPYAGKHITFSKSRPTEVQIDHIVPLAFAWRMGAREWTADKRAELANDRDNLLAVWGRPNQQKSDKGPAEWRPQRSYQCRYAERFVGVAHGYRVSITRADRDALRDMLDTC